MGSFEAQERPRQEPRTFVYPLGRSESHVTVSWRSRASSPLPFVESRSHNAGTRLNAAASCWVGIESGSPSHLALY